MKEAHGQAHLEAIDIVDRRQQTVTRHERGGRFVFIGADADTAWLPQQVARDRNGYLLTGDEVLESGRWSHTRDPSCSSPACRASPPVATCG
ncbi:MAG: hypothetical protein ACSLE9_17455 [Burkholderiaceae bacterium]